TRPYNGPIVELARETCSPWLCRMLDRSGAGMAADSERVPIPETPRWSPQSGHSWSPEIRPTGRGAFRLAPRVEKGYGKDGGHGRLGNREAISTFPQPLLLVSLSRTRRHLGTEIERPVRPDARV